MVTPEELLLPSLLAMNVYHRDVGGGLYGVVGGNSGGDMAKAACSGPCSRIGFSN